MKNIFNKMESELSSEMRGLVIRDNQDDTFSKTVITKSHSKPGYTLIIHIQPSCYPEDTEKYFL